MYSTMTTTITVIILGFLFVSFVALSFITIGTNNNSLNHNIKKKDNVECLNPYMLYKYNHITYNSKYNCFTKTPTSGSEIAAYVVLILFLCIPTIAISLVFCYIFCTCFYFMSKPCIKCLISKYKNNKEKQINNSRIVLVDMDRNANFNEHNNIVNNNNNTINNNNIKNDITLIT